jgi:protein-tyrosine phosphatase
MARGRQQNEKKAVDKARYDKERLKIGLAKKGEQVEVKDIALELVGELKALGFAHLGKSIITIWQRPTPLQLPVL